MQRYVAVITLLVLGTLPFTRGQAPRAGACGPNSIANIPGCWGTPGCSYVIASDLGPAAACIYNYCNCGGTNVPLLPGTLSGTTTMGCASYTLQPTANNCPTVVPTVPGGADGSLGSSGSSSSVSTPTDIVVVTGTFSGATITEAYTPTIYTQFSTVTAVFTTEIIISQNSTVTVTIGPSGVAWEPLYFRSGAPDLPPPAILPGSSSSSSSASANMLNPLNDTVVTATNSSSVLTQDLDHTSQATTTSSSRSSDEALQPITSSYGASQSSITGAFDNPAQSETTVVAGGIILPYKKATFDNLKTITAMTTVTTPLAQTDKDGHRFTLSAAIIVVGPGGVWWNGGTGGWGLGGRFCIWPYCPPGGGGDSGGRGSGGNPNDPNSPNSPEKPSDPDEDDDNTSSQGRSTMQSSSSSASSTSLVSSPLSSSSASSCSAITASDCSVLCSTPTSASIPSCSTTCTSTFRGCSITGTTITSSASGAACSKLSGWGSVVNGDDFSNYPTLSTAGIAAPVGTAVATPGATTTGFSASSRRNDSSTSFSSTSSSSSSSSSSGAVSPPAKTTSIPTCMADGASGYNPTNWCDCGASATYPTLPASSGAISANCAYSSLPASQLTPYSTSAAPTDIPGYGGVPGCAGVVSVPGTLAYCNCGGTPAPTLSPTVSGLMNCDYTVQPTSTYNPAMSPPARSITQPPPFATGQCNVHIWQGLGQVYGDPEVFVGVNITDASGAVIGFNHSELNWGQGFGTDSKLPDVLIVTPQTGIRNRRRLRRGVLNERIGVPPPFTPPLYEHGPVDFALGSQTWDSASTKCTVGGWDNGKVKDFLGALFFGDNFIPNRQMDCKFSCLEPSSKRSLAEIAGDFHGDDQSLPRDLHNALGRIFTSTLDRPPLPVDKDLHLLYPRVHHSKAWVKYAPKGALYYKDWKDKNGPDRDYPCDYFGDINVKLPEGFDIPPKDMQPFLHSQGYGIGREYYAIEALAPKDVPIARFVNDISPSQGVFLAINNDRGAIEPGSEGYPDGRAPVRWQFSSIAWWKWTETVLKVHPEWVDDPSQADFSGLKSFWRCNIHNPETKEILDEVFTGQDAGKVLTWTPDNTDEDTNPFWALLGSPNGNGIQYLLTENKVAMKGKGIISIKAVQEVMESEWLAPFYHMWATFG